MHSRVYLSKIFCDKTNLPQKLRVPASAVRKCLLFLFLLSTPFASKFPTDGCAKDFLTDKEIELLQNTQIVANRARIYMDAAALRLKTAKDKLSNKEYAEGDSMELLTPEEVVGAYSKILQSIHLIVGYAIEEPRRKGNESAPKALKILAAETTTAIKELEVLRRLAEEKQLNSLLDSINDAIETTNDIHIDAKEKLAELNAITPANK
jgi:hypothetical protein